MMDDERRQLCFVLALVGAILGLGMGVMMFLMGTLVTGSVGLGGGRGAGFLGLLFGWLSLAGLVGGALMLVGALRIRRGGAGTLALAGGIVAVLGGNVLAGGLGIVAGALLLSVAAPRAA